MKLPKNPTTIRVTYDNYSENEIVYFVEDLQTLVSRDNTIQSIDIVYEGDNLEEVLSVIGGKHTEVSSVVTTGTLKGLILQNDIITKTNKKSVRIDFFGESIKISSKDIKTIQVSNSSQIVSFYYQDEATAKSSTYEATLLYHFLDVYSEDILNLVPTMKDLTFQEDSLIGSGVMSLDWDETHEIGFLGRKLDEMGECMWA